MSVRAPPASCTLLLTTIPGVSGDVRDVVVIDTTVLAGPLQDLKTAGQKGSCFYLVVLHNWLSGTQQNVMAIAELCNENFTAGPLLDGDKKKMAKKTLDQLEKQYLPMGRFNAATEGLFVHQAFVFGKYCSFMHMNSEQLAALKSKYSEFEISEMIEAGEDRSSSGAEARARDVTPNPTTQELGDNEGHHIVERGDIASSGHIAGTSGRTSGLKLQKEIWKVFQKVGLLGDSSEGGMRVKVFVCMMGKGSKDAFSKPSSVLNELNCQDDEMPASIKNQAFSYVGEVAAYMYGSGSKKYLHFFSR
ncbi:hypothetical protein CEUSTIGMA_g13850.t1 [Chlamydomonas eustigma]|uniref:Uncharacterized protein n=1 Tax=Chlamydomonas eustigma TaxID=1157962 RepID=A0A250XUG2_9CHLO|nr:hypothetical protein CEUSTIGMA_g13850.t1 [Chlamydomonas eustigma]|eukprot:GAX86440.1 hypothetical protein CEUSTIGMA_g13850.t1 [Chlamydomonas eustigma]